MKLKALHFQVYTWYVIDVKQTDRLLIPHTQYCILVHVVRIIRTSDYVQEYLPILVQLLIIMNSSERRAFCFYPIRRLVIIIIFSVKTLESISGHFIKQHINSV